MYARRGFCFLASNSCLARCQSIASSAHSSSFKVRHRFKRLPSKLQLHFTHPYTVQPARLSAHSRSIGRVGPTPVVHRTRPGSLSAFQLTCNPIPNAQTARTTNSEFQIPAYRVHASSIPNEMLPCLSLLLCDDNACHRRAPASHPVATQPKGRNAHGIPLSRGVPSRGFSALMCLLSRVCCTSLPATVGVEMHTQKAVQCCHKSHGTGIPIYIYIFIARRSRLPSQTISFAQLMPCVIVVLAIRSRGQCCLGV